MGHYYLEPIINQMKQIWKHHEYQISLNKNINILDYIS